MTDLLARVRATIYEAADAAAEQPDGWYYVTVWPDGNVTWNVQASASYPAAEVTETVPHPLTIWECDGARMLDGEPMRRADPNGEYIGVIDGNDDDEEYSPDGDYPPDWERYTHDYSPSAWDEFGNYFEDHHGDDFWERIEGELTGWATTNLRQTAQR